MTTLALDDIVATSTARFSRPADSALPFLDDKVHWPALGAQADPIVNEVAAALPSGQPTCHPGHQENEIVLQKTSADPIE